MKDVIVVYQQQCAAACGPTWHVTSSFAITEEPVIEDIFSKTFNQFFLKIR
jgi:hypothetical protein